MSYKVCDRDTGRIFTEKGYGDNKLTFLYGTSIGRLLLKLIFARPWYSQLRGLFDNSPLSVRKVQPFINQYTIDMTEYSEGGYRSFNDFFVRKFKKNARPIDSQSNDLISVADARLFSYVISGSGKIAIKNNNYTVEELLSSELVASEYRGGICLIFRLAMEDCHRYCYFDNGVVKSRDVIKGKLHTVRPIRTRSFKAFSENYREYEIIRTENFGVAVVVEIGALLVGKIVNSHSKEFIKGQEKGYFGLGGSTIAVLLQKGKVIIDPDIIENSKKGLETKVKMGERIGVKSGA